MQPLLGQVCAKSCNIFQKQVDGKCVCSDNLVWDGFMCRPQPDDTWEDNTAACAGAYMVVSWDGLSCIPQCGDNEKVVDGRCEVHRAMSG